jgi:uncharacterized protein (TIGR02145 family)
MLKLKKVFRNKKVLGSLLVVIGVVGFYQIFISQGSNYSWIQSDWSGGADEVAVATHTTDQTGWTKFFSKDDNVDVTTTPGEMTLTSPSAENVDTTDADFNAMTQTTDLAGDGDFYINGDSIQLKKQEGASCTVDGECIGICESGFCILPCGDYDVQDIQGNTYSTVAIGDQCWMGENMRTTQYPDGTPITKGSATHGDTIWGTDQAYYSCPPNTTNNGEDCTAATTMGMLYQWSAAMNGSTTPEAQGICPTGWHIPTDTELYTLENYLATGTCSSTRTGYECDPAGSKLANNTADQNWTSGTLSSHTDFGTSGFDAPASGYRFTFGYYDDRSNYAYFWSSTESGVNAWRRGLDYTNSTVGRSESDKAYGFSVRCLKD